MRTVLEHFHWSAGHYALERKGLLHRPSASHLYVSYHSVLWSVICEHCIAKSAAMNQQMNEVYSIPAT